MLLLIFSEDYNIIIIIIITIIRMLYNIQYNYYLFSVSISPSVMEVH